jgi:PAS domain S-box-containing protein
MCTVDPRDSRMPNSPRSSANHRHVSPGDDPAMDRRRPGQAEQPSATKLRRMPAVVVLERLPVPVLAIDQDGTILFTNAAFAEMLGHTEHTVLQLKFHEIFRQLPADRPAAAVMRSYADQLVELAHRDGFGVRASMSKSAMLRRDDDIALAVFHDLTTRLWTDEA